MYGSNGTRWVGHAVGLPGADSVRGGSGVACMSYCNKHCLEPFVCNCQPQFFAAICVPNQHLHN